MQAKLLESSQHVRELGFVVLSSDADHERYDDAVDAFERTGDRGVLFRRLMALGMPADQVRWHGANRGERMACILP